MKSVIKAIVYFLIGLTVIFYGGAYMLPGEVRVERSIEIAAPPEKVFAIAGNLRRAPEWSPWVEIDPGTVFTFEGPEGGTGQMMRWASGNPLVGTGSQTVTQYQPPESLTVSTEYTNFGKSTATMVFSPAAGGTKVNWRFSAALTGVIDRWAGLMMDGQVGAEYEKGLNRLRALAEKEQSGG